MRFIKKEVYENLIYSEYQNVVGDTFCFKFDSVTKELKVSVADAGGYDVIYFNLFELNTWVQANYCALSME